MSARREQDNDDYVREMQEEYEAQRRVGRLVMLLCLLFPPLLFVMAGGGMDMAVESVTKGKVKRIGSREKRIALILGTVLAIAVVVAVVVGVSVAVTTKGA